MQMSKNEKRSRFSRIRERVPKISVPKPPKIPKAVEERLDKFEVAMFENQNTILMGVSLFVVGMLVGAAITRKGD